MELYNSESMTLSSNPRLRIVQEKITNGNFLTIADKIIAGRDIPVKEINGYKLKSDHVYRVVSYEMFEMYKAKGMIIGTGIGDEYQEYKENGIIYNNNRGVDWYLGGAALKYGDIILECPAYKNYFIPAFDNGCGMSIDPTVRFFKSSGAKNPIPLDMITKVIDVKNIKEQDIQLNKQKLIQLRQQLILCTNITEHKNINSINKSVSSDLKRK